MSASTPPASAADRARLYAAQRHTRRLATSHYENFTVVSLLLPRPLWQHFYNIYAFCRYADDLADEISDPFESRSALAALREGVLSMYGQQAAQGSGFRVQSSGEEALDVHPRNSQLATRNSTGNSLQDAVLTALSHTILRFDIPAEPFLKLIDAFEQDRRVNRYDTYAQVLDYCTRSADPVGRLVLYLCGYRDAERQRLSDFICTALQLTNFWQDVRRDYDERNRIYIPREDMERFGVSEADIAQRRCTPAWRALLKFEVDRAEALFDAGQALLPTIDPRYRTDIALFSLGGRAILDRIRALDYDTLNTRPALGRAARLALMIRAAAGKIV